MILRKVKGPQFHLPIGKIKLECLHEMLLTIINNHPLTKDTWNSIGTNNLYTCILFLREFLEITAGPICSELGMYLETVMSVINRKDYRQILRNNLQLFTDIVDNLQLNPNNAVICKCEVYKLPFNTPFILPCKTTTYYCFIYMTELPTSSSQLSNFMNNDAISSKIINISHFLISYYVYCRIHIFYSNNSRV